MTVYKCHNCGLESKNAKGLCPKCKGVLEKECKNCGEETEFCECSKPSTKDRQPRDRSFLK
ncbi:MAG TPA: hypothetical protein VJI46_03400 [Candidatus Nanoarchaeia archaeon]|nr:hypothetical protein [Candidatus Nanoarchaeia archaeon]